MQFLIIILNSLPKQKFYPNKIWQKKKNNILSCSIHDNRHTCIIGLLLMKILFFIYLSDTNITIILEKIIKSFSFFLLSVT